MFSPNVMRWTDYALVASGILLALYFGLHPGAPTAANARAPLYWAIGTLGVAAFGFMLVGIVGVAAQVGKSLRRLGAAGLVLAFLGSYLVGCGVFVDAYVEPVLANEAPKLLDPTGTLSSFPLVLVYVLPALAWSIGFILVSLAAIRAGAIPRWAGAAIIVGAILLDSPPEPVGPTPWAVIAIGSVIMGGGLVGFGYALRTASAVSQANLR
jgi:hypothetical protein